MLTVPAEAAIATYELSPTTNSNECSDPSYTYGVKPETTPGAQVLTPGGNSCAVCTRTSAARACEGESNPSSTMNVNSVAATIGRMPYVVLMTRTLVWVGYFRQAKIVLQY